MNQLEENIQESFTRVKNDVLKLQKSVIALSQTQARTVEILSTILQKKVPQKLTIKRETRYLASKGGKKFHIPHCPFALNIKPKFSLTFKAKNTALNQGFRPCRCVK